MKSIAAAIITVLSWAGDRHLHRFWTKPEPQRNLSPIMFLNNTGILGGLLLLWQHCEEVNRDS